MRFFLFLLIICPLISAQNNTTESMWRCYLNETAIRMWVAEEVKEQAFKERRSVSTARLRYTTPWRHSYKLEKMEKKSFGCDCGNGTSGTVMEMFTPEGCCTGPGCNCSISTTTTTETILDDDVSKNIILDIITNVTETSTRNVNTQTTVSRTVRTTNFRKSCPTNTCSDVTTTSPTATSDDVTSDSTSSSPSASSCKELHSLGYTTSGIYTITLNGMDVQLRCDQEDSGGGWTVIQRRYSGDLDFYLDWNSYKNGFGNQSEEFWIGFDKISDLLNGTEQELKVDLGSEEGETRYATYRSFLIDSEDSNYRLLNATGYSGDAGDSLSYHLSAPFTTRDQDNDEGAGYNCAILYRGAWWYKSCYRSNLNGEYGGMNGMGIVWDSWNGTGAITKTSMKIRGY